MQKSFVVAGFLIAALVAPGQQARSPLGLPGSEAVVLHGQISSGDSNLTSLSVELTSLGRGGLRESVGVNPDGSFDLGSLTSGVYQLSVSGPGGMALYQEQVNLRNPRENLFIQLPATTNAKRNSGDTVSIHQLEHKIPGSAQKALERARQAVRHGHTPEALKEFERAISIDPQFADAYNDLGAFYVKSGEARIGVEQFRRALDLDPNHPLALSNLCLVLSKLGEFEEAARIARRALQVDPGNSRVHYILAISLMNSSGGLVEALDHLQRAAPDVPMANLVAAQILIDSGKRDEARRHLKEFLATASSDEIHRPLVDALRRQLQE